ncbi:MAG TPA: FG-GAP-like repeat-containing protein [Opitutaceae bacterium]
MPADQTGVKAENNFADPLPGGPRVDPRVWSDRRHEFEVGALGTGIAIGDYDNDGRPDIFVVSKTESCRLFRNLGGMQFEDVTDRAGVGDVGDAARVWKQGATFVDIDNNGLLDLYVCRFNAPNLLYINQGDGTFREEAAARGLAVTDASVMAAFCDYDRDGHLDVFIQTNLLDGLGRPNGQRDYLFHNHGDGTFTDVTNSAGIRGEAQGHSAIWWDYDGDGWPDLYVANDFAAPDQLYRNNRDGTFTDVIDSVVPHMPYSSMGSDLGDIDNDGRIDLLVGDMAPTTHEKDQRTLAVERSAYVDPPDDSTAAPQYPRNALYLNTGTGRMLEAANLAGIAATDWTWAVRFEDLDLDGRLDLFVTNGMHHEVTNADVILGLDLADSPAQKLQIERATPVLNERHLAFRNLGDLRFEDATAEWGLDRTGVALGAAFGDLDGDGDMDLVYSTYRDGVKVFRNDADEGHRIVVALRGVRSNRCGVGSTVRIETDAGEQVRTLVLARGIVSSSEPILHFGLGRETRIRRLTVEWSCGATQVFHDLEADRRYLITEPVAGGADPGSSAFDVKGAGVSAPGYGVPPLEGAGFLLESVGPEIGFAPLMREPAVDELAEQPLLPRRFNRQGPALAVGDINGDGRDDVVVGGTPLDPARILLLGADGRFAPGDSAPLAEARPVDDGPVLLFDADGDGHCDLLITQGGDSLPAGAPEYQPRLYLNDGRGSFRRAPDAALPPLALSAGAAAAADFDRDGRLDLFIGARLLPGQYPAAPRSALLANRGGRFEDVTDALAPGLREVGMVTSALWSDVDGDGWPDLLLTLEWGRVRYFHNRQGKGFEDWTERAGFAAAGTGWWTSIATADFNGDGRPDYVVGNVGLNTPYRASGQEPALLFYDDFAGDGTVQLVEAGYEKGRLYPLRSRKDLGAAIPSILRRFRRNDDYARATLAEVLGAEKVAAAPRLAATEFRSGVFLSRADGGFEFEPLPRIAQISPLQGLAAGDFLGRGRADLLATQNSYAPIPSIGRYDGGLGQLVAGDGRGGFEAVAAAQSGWVVPGDAKALAIIDFNDDGHPDFLVSRNRAAGLAFRNRGGAGGHSIRVALRTSGGNPTGVGASVVCVHADGRRAMREVQAGSVAGSQSTSALFFGFTAGNPPLRFEVRWPSGSVSTHPVPKGAAALTLTV